MSEPKHTVSESKDKIRLETQVKRGDSTRDEDRIKVKIKGSDPSEAAEKLATTLNELEAWGVVSQLRETQPEVDE